MIYRVLEGFSPRVLETSDIEYRCYCTRERVVAALSSIGEKEKPEEIQALRGM